MWVEHYMGAEGSNFKIITGCESIDDQACERSDIEFYMRDIAYEGSTLSDKFFKTEKNNALASMIQPRSIQEVYCEPEDDRAVLYQWVIQINGYAIRTNQTICRTGEADMLSPACPDSACEDDECDLCLESWKNPVAII